MMYHVAVVACYVVQALATLAIPVMLIIAARSLK